MCCLKHIKMYITVQEKLNLTDTANWPTSNDSPQSNWWPVMSHSISDGAIGLFFTSHPFIFLIFKLPSDIVGAMQGDALYLFSSALEICMNDLL